MFIFHLFTIELIETMHSSGIRFLINVWSIYLSNIHNAAQIPTIFLYLLHQYTKDFEGCMEMEKKIFVQNLANEICLTMQMQFEYYAKNYFQTAPSLAQSFPHLIKAFHFFLWDQHYWTPKILFSIWEYQSNTVKIFAWIDEPIFVLVLQTLFDAIQKRIKLFIEL